MQPQTETTTVSHWHRRLTQAVVCLACFAAGATLVALATPTSRVAAGAAQPGAPLPETVLLDFTATWCGPCQQMSPIIDRLAQQGYPVRKIDVDRERDIAERFGIQSMPTFVLVVKGREVMRQTGMTSEAQLRRMLQQIPQWEQELADKNRRNVAGTQLASNDVFDTPPVDLGPVETTPPKTEPKRPFPLSLFPRQKPNGSTPAQEPPAVRAQSRDDQPATPVIDVLTNASVRLRVKDATGTNMGSGTIIQYRSTQTLILTCGHLFTHLDENGLVEVDVFDANRRAETHVGRVLLVDQEADLGIVAIHATLPLTPVAIASLDQALVVGEKLLGIGCGGGQAPTREELAVTALNKYEGPDTIECTGLPSQGRSGGGLFRGKQLIGVCILADKDSERGVYCGLKPIYDLIEKTGNGPLLPVGRPAISTELAATTTVDPGVTSNPQPPTAPASVLPPPAEPNFGRLFAEEAGQPGTDVAGAAEELRASLEQTPDAEIIVIVRPKNSSAPSRVVVVNQASPKLMSYLLDVPESRPAPAAALAAEAPAPRAESLTPTSANTRALEEAIAVPRKPTRPTSPRSAFGE